jgi:hypothetical protein
VPVGRKGFAAGIEWRGNRFGRPRTMALDADGVPIKATSRWKYKRGLREMAREHTEAALAVIVELMKNPQTPASVRLACANSLLDRGHGKPALEINTSSTSMFDKMSDSELLQFLTDGTTIEGEVIDRGVGDEDDPAST